MSLSDLKLLNLHLGAGLMHAANTAFSAYWVNKKLDTAGDFTVINQFANGPPGDSVPDIKEIGSYKLARLVPVFPALSMVNHFYSYFFPKHYLQQVNKGANPVRWSEFSISAGIMLIIISQLSSNNDIKQLEQLVLSNMALQAVGYLVEKETAQGIKDGNNHHYEQAMLQELIGFLILASQWSTIFTSFFTSLEESSEEAPDAVYAIIFVMFSLFVTFGVLSIFYMRGQKAIRTNWWKGEVRDFRQVEVGYITLSFVSKTLLTYLVLFGSVIPVE